MSSECAAIESVFKEINAGLQEKDLDRAMSHFSPDSKDMYRFIKGHFSSTLEQPEGVFTIRLGDVNVDDDSAEVAVFTVLSHKLHERENHSAYWLTFEMQKLDGRWMITSHDMREYTKARHIDLNVELFPEAGTIKGTAAIDYEVVLPGENNLVLTLNRGLKINSLKDKTGKDLTFERVGSTAIIPRDSKFKGGETGGLAVEFEGTFFNEAKEMGFSQVAISPEGCFASWVTSWYPMLDCNLSKCPGNLNYTVPNGLTVISSGLRTAVETGDKTTTFRFKVSNPLNFSFAAADYTFLTERIHDIDVGAYFLGGDLRNAKEYIDTCSEMITLFIDIYGFYPFDQYCVVEIPREHTGVLGGSSEQGMNLFPQGMLPEGTMNEFVISHEIGHSWWGNLVGGGMVQSEVMAQFTASLWFEHKYGEEGLRSLLNNGFNTTSTQYGESYLKLIADMPESDRTLGSYSPEDTSIVHQLADTKGHFVMHMLRDQIGEADFYQAIQNILKEFAGGDFTLAEFREAFENTSGQELEWFFDQWLYQKGAPEFILNHNVEKVTDGYRISGTVEQTGDFYRALAEIGCQLQGEWQVFPVEITETPMAFDFTVTEKPDRVSFDPFQKLLRWRPELKVTKELKKVRTLNAVNQGQKARKEMDNLLASVPESLKARVLSGEVFLNIGQTDEAIGEFQKAMMLHEGMNTGVFTPDYLQALLKLGQSYDIAGRRDDAVKCYTRIIDYPVYRRHMVSAAEEGLKEPFQLPTVYEMPDEKLREYVGKYAVEGLVFTLWLDDDGVLRGQQPDSPEIALVPLGPDELSQISTNPYILKFVRNEENVITGADVYKGERKLITLEAVSE